MTTLIGTKPYSPSSGDLPPAVRKLSPKRKRQWVTVFNSILAKTGDESRAFAGAYSAVKLKEFLDNFKHPGHSPQRVHGGGGGGLDLGQVDSAVRAAGFSVGSRPVLNSSGYGIAAHAGYISPDQSRYYSGPEAQHSRLQSAIRDGLPDGYPHITDGGWIRGSGSGSEFRMSTLSKFEPNAREYVGKQRNYLSNAGVDTVMIDLESFSPSTGPSYRTVTIDLNRGKAKKTPQSIIDDSAFWATYRKEILRVAKPIFLEAYRSGVETAHAVVTKSKGLGFKQTEEEINALIGTDINAATEDEIELYAQSFALGLEEQFRERIQDLIIDAFKEGWGADETKAKLEHLLEQQFSPSRAHTIAVTETSRMYGKGAQAAYKAMEIEEWRWMTVNDSRVCPECSGKANKEYPVEDEFEPAHTRCRCFPSPVPPAVPTIAQAAAQLGKSAVLLLESVKHPGHGDQKVHGRRFHAFTNDVRGQMDFLAQMPPNYSNTYSEAERDALMAYTGSRYDMINGPLRGDSGVLSMYPGAPAISEKYAPHIDSAMAKSKTPADVEVYRGANKGAMADLAAGKVVTDKGYVSVSLDSKTAAGFNPDQVVAIRVPKGTPAVAGNGGEMELILPRGTSFRVREVGNRFVEGRSMPVLDIASLGVVGGE